jgi:hypothetical protein
VHTAAAIRSAVDDLTAQPLVGQRIEGEVRVLALRHQRELGFLP